MKRLQDLADDWPRLNRLLDEALELEPAQRAGWLDALPAEHAGLRDTLAQLLQAHGGLETGQLLHTMPRLDGLAAAAGSDVGVPVAGDEVGPWRLLRELGQGGMGSVWLAERADGQLKRQVALKLPRLSWARGLAERMARERDILASLEHPHISRLYDAGVDELGRPWLALEYVQGQDIDQHAHRQALDVKQRVQLLLQVCEAVAYAHSRLVIHRDLKPGNILVTEEGQVKLLDFGIAKLVQNDGEQATALTELGGRALTLEYASPEQVRGEALTTASDVYSLGVVAYELLAGARPYKLKRGSAAELEQAIAELDVPLASRAAAVPATGAALRGDLDAVLDQALKKDPNRRYTTVDAMARDLRAYLEGAAVTARPDSLAYRLMRLARKHRRNLAAGALVSLAFGVGVGVGATTLIIVLLSAGLAGALWLVRRAQAERNLALALSDRNEAASTFVNTLLTQASRAGEPLTADQLLERSEKLLDEEFKDSPESVATVLSMMAMSAHTLGHADRALQLMERAMTAVRSTKDPALRHKTAILHAVAMGHAGQPEEAASAIEQLLARGGLRPDEAYEANYYLCSLDHIRGSDAHLMLRHAQEALRLHAMTRRPDKQVRASVLAELADALFDTGHVDEADRRYAEVMQLFKSLGKERTPSALVRRGNWGVMLDSIGDLPAARAEFDQSIAVALEDASGVPPSFFLVIGRARAVQQMGLLDEAEAGLRQALAQAGERGMLVGVQHSRCSLALLALDRGDAATARSQLRDYDDDRRIQVPASSKTARLRQLADGRLALFEQRLQHAVEAFSIAAGDGARSAMAVMGLLGRTEAHLQIGEHDAALEHAQRALDMARALQGSRHPSFRTGLALFSLACIADARQSPSEARALSAQALAQLELTVDPAHPARVAAARMARGRQDPAAAAVAPSAAASRP